MHRRILAALALVALICACGTKGPLYLPPPVQPSDDDMSAKRR